MNSHVTRPKRATFPLEFYDHIPFVRVQLNGEERLFLFDSGAQDFLLNSRYLPEDDSGDVGYALGATGKVAHRYVIVENLEIGEWRFENREALAMDLKHAEDEYGTEIHGIMGFRQLIHFDWMVDYHRKELHLWERFPKTEHTILGKAFAPFKDHLPMVKVSIGGEEFKMLIDTGASMFVMTEENRERVMTHVEEEGTKMMASASPVEAEVGKGTLKGFKIGDLDFGPCEINFMDLSHMQRGMIPFDGIVGYPVLGQYRTVVSWNYHVLYFLEG